MGATAPRSLTATGARAARRQVDRALAVADPGRVPDRFQGYVARARIRQAHRSRTVRPRRSVALLTPLLEGPYGAQAADALIGPLVALGEHRRAVQLLASRPERTPLPLAPVLQLHTAVTEAQDEEAAATTLGLVSRLRPGNQQEFDAIVTTLRRGGSPEHAQVVLDRVRDDGLTLDVTALSDWVHERALRADLQNPDADVAAVVRRFREQVEHPWPAIIRILSNRGEWDLLAAEADHIDPLDTEVPHWQLSKAARAAAVQGWLTAAGRLAEVALAGRPDLSEDLVPLLASTRDQLTLLAQGWPQDPISHSEAATPRDPRAVLSLLGQSLPLRSGGYATRSHGILTGLAQRGWHMTAATRLGFPYDLWWDKDDERELSLVDTVDGIDYHRLLVPGVTEYSRVPLVDYVRTGVDLATALGKEAQISLVHASSLSDVGLLGMETAERLGVPFLYEMRGLKQLLEEARLPRFRGSERDRHLDEMERLVATRADHLVVITAALGELMADMGVDPSRITVVPNGVHVDKFTPREPDLELRRELGITASTVIGYAGSITKYEGLNLLLDAAAVLRGQGVDFHVLIVGDGAYEKAIRRHCAALGLGDLVTFTGRVPHEEVERYLSLFDITPFPRLPLPVCELISPIKPFEAMATRKSVVVSDVAALTEIVADGETGRTFAKGDADDLARVLGELIEDSSERERLGRQAHAWVREHHDWSTITSRVDSAYRRLLGPAASSTAE